MPGHPSCVLAGPGPHGRLHQYFSRKVAEADGTPVNAPEVEIYMCEFCYPDLEDPKFSLCCCRLCVLRRKNTN